MLPERSLRGQSARGPTTGHIPSESTTPALPRRAVRVRPAGPRGEGATGFPGQTRQSRNAWWRYHGTT